MLRFSIKKNFHLGTLILLMVLVGTLGFLEFNYSYAESHENKRESFSEPKKVGDNEYSYKIHPQIIKIMNHTQPENKARSYGASFQNNELDVYVYLNSEFQNNPPKGLNLLAQDGNIIFTRLTFDQIENISYLESVDGITLPINAVPRGHVVSEGVAWSFADDMHAEAFTGSGVTVAVIDTGFDSSNSEISGNIGFSSFQTGCGNLLCGDTAGDSHGTSVAEAVVDMAPDVNLRVYAVLNTVGFNNAIDNAIANNADIITSSLAFIEAGGDGTTGQYRDGTSTVAKKVNDAKNAGILVTASVGNQGESHWQGTYSVSPVTPSSIGLNPSIYESVMNFRPSQSGVQRACLPVTDIGDTYLATWNDWNNSNQDYDFFLYNEAMNAVIDFSANTQDGIGLDNPIEIIPATGPFDPSTLCLVIASDSSTQNHFFHIDTEGNSVNDPHKVRAGSLDTPADATGALAVGAINQATDVLEAFSSSGPTDDSRNKPEICGPDNTFTHQSGLNPFFGTSIATPHVAGAAALLLEQIPNLSVEQLKHKLIDEARFNASYSVDNLCGNTSGALSLQTAALTDVYIPVGVSVPGCENTNSCYLPFTHTIFSGTQVTWYNGDTAAHTVTSGTPQDGPDGSFDSSLFMSGTSFLHTFNSAGTFDYFCMVHPWMTGKVIVNPNACSVPESDDWTVTSDCTLMSSAIAPGKVIVQNNSVVTIPNGVTLDIDFANFNLTIKSGSGVLIKSGGKIT